MSWSGLSWLYQSYSYDNVNRLTGVTDTGYTRTFGYDPYGNMWVTGNSGVALAGNTPTANVFTAANQIPGNNYDAAGNLLSVNGNAASYDAENRLASVSESPAYGGGSETLLYDGLGQRVEKTITGGTTTVYVYDAFGKLAAEYASSPVQTPCTTCYLVRDQLGPTRLVTDQNGMWWRGTIICHSAKRSRAGRPGATDNGDRSKTSITVSQAGQGFGKAG